MNKEKTNKLICIVGMCGAGKSEVSEYLMKKKKFGYIRFGQITLDKIKEMGEMPNEKIEREVREGFRRDHGMAAFAILNLPKINDLIQAGDLIADGLYSWEEYLELKNKFADSLIVITVYAPPKVRYERLTSRSEKHKNDPEKKFRSFTEDEAKSRDQAEIENSHKAGPIAMADFTLINTDSIENLHRQIDQIYKEVYGG
jgi:dephospho-CoA kinase